MPCSHTRSRISLLAAAVTTAAAALLALGGYAPAQGKQTPAPAGGDPELACRNRLKRCALAMMQYVQDQDGRTFPPMRTAKQVQNRLRPFVKADDVFYCPATKRPYQPNQSLGGKSFVGLKDHARTPMLFDAKPHPNGAAHTAYADGHVAASPKAVRRTNIRP